jgi:hypothetical protein
MYLHALKPVRGSAGRAALPGGLLFLVSCLVSAALGSGAGLFMFVLLGAVAALVGVAGRRQPPGAGLAMPTC